MIRRFFGRLLGARMPNLLEPDLLAEVMYTCSANGDVRVFVSKLDLEGQPRADFITGMVRCAIGFANAYGVTVGITVNGTRVRLNDFVQDTRRSVE